MASATLRILLLAACLTTAAPTWADAAAPGPAVAESMAGQTEPDTQAPAEGDDAGQTFHALSTLGALTLGILGLLWVRRHTAQL